MRPHGSWGRDDFLKEKKKKKKKKKKKEGARGHVYSRNSVPNWAQGTGLGKTVDKLRFF
jgi:hypothetical protein